MRQLVLQRPKLWRTPSIRGHLMRVRQELTTQRWEIRVRLVQIRIGQGLWLPHKMQPQRDPSASNQSTSQKTILSRIENSWLLSEVSKILCTRTFYLAHWASKKCLLRTPSRKTTQSVTLPLMTFICSVTNWVPFSSNICFGMKMRQEISFCSENTPFLNAKACLSKKWWNISIKTKTRWREKVILKT